MDPSWVLQMWWIPIFSYRSWGGKVFGPQKPIQKTKPEQVSGRLGLNWQSGWLGVKRLPIIRLMVEKSGKTSWYLIFSPNYLLWRLYILYISTGAGFLVSSVVLSLTPTGSDPPPSNSDHQNYYISVANPEYSLPGHITRLPIDLNEKRHLARNIS